MRRKASEAQRADRPNAIKESKPSPLKCYCSKVERFINFLFIIRYVLKKKKNTKAHKAFTLAGVAGVAVQLRR